jgi:flagellar basal-body rod modification protein FlgD
MTTIDTAAPIRGAAPPENSSTARTALSSDLDTFLRLLTAQIRNQDPLQPADGTEYAAQLAQFSAVEQAVRSNELLAEIGEGLAGGDAAAASWIGLEVRHDGPVAVDGSARRLLLDPAPLADRAELVAYDEAGAEVLRRPLDPRAETFDWAGGDGDGGHLADGPYRLELASWAGERALDPRPVFSYARVEEVALGTGGPTLVLAGGVRIAPDRADAIRGG